MDLSKYVSLLKSQALYFCPLTALDDPFEGASPDNISYEGITRSQLDRGEISKPSFDTLTNLASLARPVLLGCTYVNCWHLSSFESEAMWKLYSASADSVCIQTTSKSLRNQLPDTANFGKVRYIDFATYQLPEPSLAYDPAFLKRQSFEHEKEVRAVIVDYPIVHSKRDAIRHLTSLNKTGKYIAVDVQELIARVHINPLAQSWFADLVGDITNRYGYQFEISQSALSQKPKY